MISQVNFNVIKEIQYKADIVAVISSFIKLTRKGNNYIGICPFHADKNPSLVVSPKKRIFKCFVCNAKGNVFGFVQQYKKVPFMEAVKLVAKIIGYDDSKLNFRTTNTYLDPKIKRLIDLNNQVHEWFQGFLYAPENKKQLDYLNQRGLDNEIIKAFGFGYAPHNMDLIYRMTSNADNMFGTNRSQELIWNEKELLDAGLITINQEGKVFDFFIDRIMIPIYDNNGYLVGFSGRTIRKGVEPKYLNTGSTKLFAKANVLFNFHKAKTLDNEKIIIVEGFMDAIAYARAGYQNVVATMGVALSAGHINALRTLTKLETVILSFDNDNAGVMATITNGQKLMENGFNTYVVGNYDKSIKDVDELFTKQGKEAINHILEERTDFVSFLINNEFQNKKPLDEIQKSVNKIITGILDFGDDSLLLRQQHLKLIADRTGLAFEDLKAKYDQEFAKLGINNKSTTNKWQPHPLHKPDNDVGLNKTFIENEEQVEAPPAAVVHERITFLENDLRLTENRLNEGYSQLILALINYPEGFKKVEDEINPTLTEFPLVQQQFVFKGIQYICNKNLLLNEETLSALLKEKGGLDNNVARNYQGAFEYFKELIDRFFYQTYSKSKLIDDPQKHIDDTINNIQVAKYKYLMGKYMLNIWKLSKDNKEGNKLKIDQIQKDMNDIKENNRQWELSKKKKRK